MRDFASLVSGRFSTACFERAGDDAVYTTHKGQTIPTRAVVRYEAKTEGILRTGSNFGARQVNAAQEEIITAALPRVDGENYRGLADAPLRDETFTVGGLTFAVKHVLEKDQMRFLVRVQKVI